MTTKDKWIIVTRTQIEDFILAQKPYREVNFDSCSDMRESCGCLMVHYGQNIDLSKFRCGINSWDSQDGLLAKTRGWSYETWGTNHETYETLQQEVLDQRDRKKKKLQWNKASDSKKIEEFILSQDPSDKIANLSEHFTGLMLEVLYDYQYDSSKQGTYEALQHYILKQKGGTDDS